MREGYDNVQERKQMGSEAGKQHYIKKIEKTPSKIEKNSVKIKHIEDIRRQYKK